MKELIDLTNVSTSPFHAIEQAKKQLLAGGFTEIQMRDEWELKRGGKYLVIHHLTSLFAFTVGQEFTESEGVRIAAAHGDFPTFCIKPNPEMVKDGYVQLNVEPYGGANLGSWQNRPLSVAGRIVLKSADPFKPLTRLVDFKRPILIIPSIAMHLEREMNKGVPLNPQTHMLPLLGMTDEKVISGLLDEMIGSSLGVDREDILDYELYLYNTDEGCFVGMSDEFISAPRLDNVSSVHALLQGILEEERAQGINLIAIFDHEEVGSKTKQGAGSTVLANILEKIYLSLGSTKVSFMNALTDSMLMSVDVSHALHPSYAMKNDPTNKVVLNKGMCIKEACSQSYATDGEMVAIIQQICQQEGIPYQRFVNRSDGTRGGTLGSIASTMLPVRTADIGIPLLAMHSSREMMGSKDQESLIRFIQAYFRLI